jgi:hypothetical protein
MSEAEKVIAEDLKAAVAAFKDDAFLTVNILANRSMTNAILSENRKIFLPGFFLKDVAFDFGVLKAKQQAMAFSTAKAHGFSYVESLAKSLSSLDEEKLWNDYHSYCEKMRSYEITEWEEKSYSPNTLFTNETFRWLMSYLHSHTSFLFDPANALIKGIINEMNRVCKVHSATLHDLVIRCLMIALDRNYDYACRFWNGPEMRIINENQIKGIILPAVDNIVALSNKEFKIEEADSLLWELVKTWRELFILYGELLSPAVAGQKGIELPEDLKRKLTESLTKTLEKEM